jgi:hypothetical protein
MILSKLNNGAMGAAGKGVPDKATQKAWVDATTQQAVGADQWHTIRENGATAAGIVREVAPRKVGARDVPAYRLNLVCAASGQGEIQLTWSPEPQTGRTIAVTLDRKQTLEYRIEGRETMGNGQAGSSGLASVLLTDRPGGGGKLRLPKQSLTVRELFAGEIVEFVFSGLDARTRKELERCFDSVGTEPTATRREARKRSAVNSPR